MKRAAFAVAVFGMVAAPLLFVGRGDRPAYAQSGGQSPPVAPCVTIPANPLTGWNGGCQPVTQAYPLPVTISGVTTSTVSVNQGTVPWVDNVTQFGGSNIVTGPGPGGAGIPRVTVSNDSAVLTTPGGFVSTMTTAAPISATFASVLSSNAARKACLIQNNGTGVGYVYFGATASAATANAFQVAANGGNISCATYNGIVLVDNVAATCATGTTCAFVIGAQ